MNAYANRLLDVAAQLRSLGGQAGAINNHLPAFERLSHEVECCAMAVESGAAAPARCADANTIQDAWCFIDEGRKALAKVYAPDSWRLRELVAASEWLQKTL